MIGKINLLISTPNISINETTRKNKRNISKKSTEITFIFHLPCLPSFKILLPAFHSPTRTTNANFGQGQVLHSATICDPVRGLKPGQGAC